MRLHSAAAVLLTAAFALPLAAQDQEQRPVVRSLSFDGNRAISDAQLRTSITTSQSSAFARWPGLRGLGLGEKKLFDEVEFRRDVQRIQGLYRVSGFVEATVDTSVRRSARDVDITFRIREGQPVRVTSLSISGIEGIVSERWLLRNVPLQVGDPFSRLVLQASVDSIKSVLRNRGYPFVEVYRNFDEDRTDRTALVDLVVDPGPLVTIDSVIVVGTAEVEDAVVRRAIDAQPGQRFSEQALRRSQLDLYRTGLFNYVTVGIADSVPGFTPDSSVKILVRVTEGPFRRMRLGGGYGTIDCFRGLGSWTVNDFMGGGRSLQLSARLSQIGVGSQDAFSAGLEGSVCNRLSDEPRQRLRLNYDVRLSLREPFVLSRRASATVSLFTERHSEIEAFVREAVGGELSLTRESELGVPVTLAYSLSHGQTVADDAIYCTFFDVCREADIAVFSQRRTRSVLSLEFARDRSNALLDPTSGSRLTMELRHASSFIGSDSLNQFNKGVIEFASYHRAGRRSVFAWRLRLGAIIGPFLQLTGQEARFVPPEERFYAGGPNSVRGFGQNELGPLVRVIDTVLTTGGMIEVSDQAMPEEDSVIRTSATGGNQLVVANAELRFPVGFDNRLTGALFVDAGQVFGEGEHFDLTEVRVTPGAGLRMASPLGPVRLDIGFNPRAVRRSVLYRKEERELSIVDPAFQPERGFLGRFRIHFSVGQAF